MFTPNFAEYYKNNLKGEIDTAKEIKALDMAFNSGEATNLVEARSIAHNMFVTSPQSLQSQIIPSVIKTAANELLQGKYPKTLGELAVNGNDLMALGLQGKEVGDALKMMLLKVYSNSVNNNKDELLTLLQKNNLNENKSYKTKQLYDYDCGVATIITILKYFNIDYDSYKSTQDKLKTTKSFGTLPLNMKETLSKYDLTVKKELGNVGYTLLNWNKVHDDNDNENGHWCFYEMENNEIKIFDAWSNRTKTITKNELFDLSKNVNLKNNNYNNIVYSVTLNQ